MSQSHGIGVPSIREIVAKIFKSKIVKRATLILPALKINRIIQILHKLEFNLNSLDIFIQILQQHSDKHLASFLEARLYKIAVRQYEGPKDDQFEGNVYSLMNDLFLGHVQTVIGKFGTQPADLAATRAPYWREDNDAIKQLGWQPVTPEQRAPELGPYTVEPDVDEDEPAPGVEVIPPSDKVIEELLRKQREEYNRLYPGEPWADDTERRPIKEQPTQQQPSQGSSQGLGLKLGQVNLQIDKVHSIQEWVGWMIEAGFDLSAFQRAQDLARYSIAEPAQQILQLTYDQWKQLWSSGEVQQFVTDLDKDLNTLSKQNRPQLIEEQKKQQEEQRGQDLAERVTFRDLDNRIVSVLIPKMLIFYRMSPVAQRGPDGSMLLDEKGIPVIDLDNPSFKPFINQLLGKLKDRTFIPEALANGNPVIDTDAIVKLVELAIKKKDAGGYNQTLAPIIEQIDKALVALNATTKEFDLPNFIEDPNTGAERQPTKDEMENAIEQRVDVIVNKAMELDAGSEDLPAWMKPREVQHRETKEEQRQRQKQVNEAHAAKVEKALIDEGLLKILPANFDPQVANSFRNPPLQEGFHYGQRLDYYVIKAGRRVVDPDDPDSFTTAPAPSLEPIVVDPSSDATGAGKYKAKLPPEQVKRWHNQNMPKAYIGKGIFVRSKMAVNVPRLGNFIHGPAVIVGVVGGPAALSKEQARRPTDPPPMLLVWSPTNKSVFGVQPRKGQQASNFENDRYNGSVDTGVGTFPGYNTDLTNAAVAEDEAYVNLPEKMGYAMTIRDVVKRVMAQVAPSNPFAPTPTPFGPEPQPESSMSQIPMSPDGQPVQPGDIIQPPNVGGGGDPQQKGKVQEVTPGGDVIFQNEMGNKVVQKPNEPTEVIKQAVHIAMQKQVSKRLVQ